MASQANLDKAQAAMIYYTQKALLPLSIIGLIFLVAEIYFIIHWSENIFSAILLFELLVTVISYLVMYFYVEKRIED